MEMKFYEKIGVRQWKKFVLWLMAQIIRDPEERKGGNYYLKERNLNEIRKFRKQLLLNGTIHAFAITLNIINIMQNNFISFSTLFQTGWFFVNLYCIMLQRYNWIRIKNLLKKSTRK